jgi:hypothetical protein
MADDGTTEAQTGEQQAGDAGQQPKYLTEDALDAKLKGFQDSLFSMVRKMSGAAPTSEKRQESKQQRTEPTTKAPTEDVHQRLAAIESKERFLEAVADLGLNKAQMAKARRLWDAEAPSDVNVWAKEVRDLFGAGGDSVQTQNAEPEQKAVSRPPTPPAGTTAGDAGADVTRWTHEDYERQFALKAKVPSNKYDIRNREFYREVRRRAEASMLGTRIQLDTKRQP